MKNFNKIASEQSVSQRMAVCDTKYGHESVDFSVKNQKKKAIALTLMAHNLVYSFDRIDALLSKYDDDRRGFITKNS